MKLTCENCGRPVFGLWKYLKNNSGKAYCSKKCFRVMLRTGVIPMLLPDKAYPELGIQKTVAVFEPYEVK